MIYFAQLANGNIKIGYTYQPIRDRLIILECATKGPVKLLAVEEGGRKREEELHNKFSHLRLGRSEQFTPERSLMRHIWRYGFDTARMIGTRRHYSHTA
jgi:hypothetical protein